MIKDRRNQEIAKSMAECGRTAPCVCPICRRRIINKHGEAMWRYPDQVLMHKKCWRRLLKVVPRGWVASAGRDMRSEA